MDHIIVSSTYKLIIQDGYYKSGCLIYNKAVKILCYLNQPIGNDKIKQ